jgi:hypothetical protein
MIKEINISRIVNIVKSVPIYIDLDMEEDFAVIFDILMELEYSCDNILIVYSSNIDKLVKLKSGIISSTYLALYYIPDLLKPSFTSGFSEINLPDLWYPPAGYNRDHIFP